jgi:hypothetical protein
MARWRQFGHNSSDAPVPLEHGVARHQGAALGTVLARMMSAIALPVPEMIILRKVLKPKLIATFAGVVAAGILLAGYVLCAQHGRDLGGGSPPVSWPQQTKRSATA